MLTRLTDVDGDTRLSLVDRLVRTDAGGVARLRTAGRDLPGASRDGDYAVVSGPVAFVTGRVSGPAAIVTADGLPFVFETEGANGAFSLPVLAGAPFALHFFNAITGATLGSANGQAPQAGTAIDIGRPLAPAAGTLTVSAQPDVRSTADIGTPIVFTFSEGVDRSSVTAAAFVVTDAAGVRVFGQVAVNADGRTVTFVPSRRWRFGARYRYGVSTNIVAASGARMAQQFAGEFTTFAPRVLGTIALGGVHDVAVNGTVGIAGTATGTTVLDLSRPDAPSPMAAVSLAGGARGVAISTVPLSDRSGQATATPIAIVAAGDAASAGVVRTYSLAAPATPALLGSTQITTPAGSAAPANVTECGRCAERGDRRRLGTRGGRHQRRWPRIGDPRQRHSQQPSRSGCGHWCAFPRDRCRVGQSRGVHRIECARGGRHGPDHSRRRAATSGRRLDHRRCPRSCRIPGRADGSQR